MPHSYQLITLASLLSFPISFPAPAVQFNTVYSSSFVEQRIINN